MNNFNQQLDSIKKEIDIAFDSEIIPTLSEYITIPNKSPSFDPEWEKNGYMQQAMNLIETWVKKQPIKGMTHEILNLPGRTPLLFIDVSGEMDETVLLYGHMDKQPEMAGWDKDKDPWKPVLISDKLYGRGAADDGYAVFSSLLAIRLLQAHNIPHGRCVLIIEGCEESGSYDLPFYLEALGERIGNPNLIICLDSWTGNYEQLWSTTSLRGLVSGKLEIEVLKEGLHSGMGSGVAPSVMMILRQLLDRIEDSHTGQMKIDAFTTTIPDESIKQAKQAAEMLENSFIDSYAFAQNTQPITNNLAELILNRTWRPQLSITGIEGYPHIKDAGNVTIPKAHFKLSVRIPPLLKSSKLNPLLKEILEKNPPFNAKITFTPMERATGWQSPPIAPWLLEANEQASLQFFNKKAAYIGEGGLIPFMGMLGRKFPEAQFLITGVLGPHSNAHGPNEFLHIPMAKKITGCTASIIASHYKAFSSS